jgi:hypothetical protein
MPCLAWFQHHGLIVQCGGQAFSDELRGRIQARDDPELEQAVLQLIGLQRDGAQAMELP